MTGVSDAKVLFWWAGISGTPVCRVCSQRVSPVSKSMSSSTQRSGRSISVMKAAVIVPPSERAR